MASPFKSAGEFREVMDRVFTMMSDDPEMGPQLREADTPQRFEFTDLDMVVNIRAGGPEEPNLAWVWSDDAEATASRQAGVRWLRPVVPGVDREVHTRNAHARRKRTGSVSTRVTRLEVDVVVGA